MSDKEDRKLGPVWVTKYVLTKGILRYETARQCVSVNENMIEVGGRWKSLYHKNEWFLSEEEAQHDARKRIARRMVSLDKQIQKLGRTARDGCPVIKGE